MDKFCSPLAVIGPFHPRRQIRRELAPQKVQFESSEVLLQMPPLPRHGGARDANLVTVGTASLRFTLARTCASGVLPARFVAFEGSSMTVRHLPALNMAGLLSSERSGADPGSLM